MGRAFNSAEGRGLFTTHLGYAAWLPLSDITPPSRFEELIAAEEARIAEDLKSPNVLPGLHEQYEYQLQLLRDPEAIDTEFIFAPFFIPSPSGTCL